MTDWNHHLPGECRERDSLLAPLERMARGATHLLAGHLPFRDVSGRSGRVPRYRFSGPGDVRSHLRVGIFAGIHGDEVSGIFAAVELIGRLMENPELARGYELFIYPVVNSAGFRENSRWSESGLDLNREFWKGSAEGEVQVIERELMQWQFNGLIALHSDDTSEGLYGFVKGHELTRYVLEPALEAAGCILPRNLDRSIDNFEANNGIIERGYAGILSAPPGQKPEPFEIVFETPHLAEVSRQIEAHIAATLSILDRFKVLISEGQNI